MFSLLLSCLLSTQTTTYCFLECSSKPTTSVPLLMLYLCPIFHIQMLSLCQRLGLNATFFDNPSQEPDNFNLSLSLSLPPSLPPVLPSSLSLSPLNFHNTLPYFSYSTHNFQMSLLLAMSVSYQCLEQCQVLNVSLINECMTAY